MEEKTQKTEEKPLSVLEESKQLIERLEKVKAEQKTEADRLELLKSEAMLSGTAGARPTTQEHVETAGEYAKRMLRGGK